jgi:hypothetical protein
MTDPRLNPDMAERRTCVDEPLTLTLSPPSNLRIGQASSGGERGSETAGPDRSPLTLSPPTNLRIGQPSSGGERGSETPGTGGIPLTLSPPCNLRIGHASSGGERASETARAGSPLVPSPSSAGERVRVRGWSADVARSTFIDGPLTLGNRTVWT